MRVGNLDWERRLRCVCVFVHVFEMLRTHALQCIIRFTYIKCIKGEMVYALVEF